MIDATLMILLAWASALCRLLLRTAKRIAETPHRPRVHGIAAVLVVAALLLPGMSGLAGGFDKEEQRSEPRRASESSPAEAARQDLYGDPLPAGALVRLGTLRYRQNPASMHPGGGFLSDGTYVSRTWSGRLAMWDVQTGQINTAHQGFDIGDQNLVHFQVLPDGESIVTLSLRINREKREYKQLLQFWKDGQLSQTITWVVEITGRFNALASTPDGTTIVSGSMQGELKFWDRASGTEILTHKFSDLDIQSIGVSPDGQIMAVAGTNRRGPASVYVWDWLSGKEPVAFQDIERRVSDVTFSPDGRLLAMGTEAGVRLWDVKSGSFQRRLKAEASRYLPDRMAFTGNGQFLAVPTGSNKVELWNVSTGQVERTFETGAVQPKVVSISPDDRWLVASGSDPPILVWNLETGKRVGEAPGHTSRILSMKFSPDGKKVVTAGLDRTIRIWNAETGKQERVLQHERYVWDVAVSPDSRLIASNSADDTVGVWDADSGKQIYRLFGHGRLGGRRGVIFSPEGKKILSWGDNLSVRVWDVDTGKALSDAPIRPAGVTIPEDESGEAQIGDPLEMAIGFADGTFTSDARQFLLAWRQTVSVFDVSTGKELRALQINNPVELRSISSSSGGHLLTTIVRAKSETAKPAGGTQNVTSSQQHLLQIRSIETGEISRTIPLPDAYSYVQPKFSPNDELVAIAPISPDTGIHVYDVDSGRLRYRIPPVETRVMVLAFSPDGSRLASAHYDTTILIWDLDDFQVEKE